MSILIKGMEMPKNCEECNLESFCDLWVDAKRMCGDGFTDSKARVKATIRHPNCPLTELPPHGDLIDRYAAIRSAFKGEQNIYCWDEIEEAIDSVPAIIESEE